MLSVENLAYHYKGRPAVLKDVNFKVNTGEFLAILGNNGVGKSTMLKCFNKIIKIQPVLRQCHNIGRLIFFLCLKCCNHTGDNRNNCTKSKEDQRYIFNDQPEDCTNGIMFFSFLHIYIMFFHRPMPLPFRLSLPVFLLLILHVLLYRTHPHSQHHGRCI